MQGTWETETSQYPEEKKSIEMPQVTASESGRGQTESLQKCKGDVVLLDLLLVFVS